jgi:hypothetical protein
MSMRNGKLYSKPRRRTGPIGRAPLAPLAPARNNLGCKPEEGLRLLRAFLQIADSSQRARLIAEAERISQET